MLGLLLGALWLALLWSFLGQHPSPNADALYLSDLLQCLKAGRGIGSWDLPPAPSLFPDLGLLWLARLMTHSLMDSLRVYGLLLGTGLWLLSARFLKALFRLRRGLAWSYAAAGLILGLLLSPAGSGITGWALPGHHGAAFIAALGYWAWTLRQKERASSWGRSLFLALLLGLLAHSDRVLWIWAALPMLLLSLRLNLAGQRRVWALLGLALLLAWLTGLALGATGARRATLHWQYLFLRSHAEWLAVLGGLPAFLQSYAALLLAMALSVGLWILAPTPRDSAFRVTLLAWGLVALLSLAMATLLGSFNGRYLYPVLLVPVLLLPLFLAERGPSWDRPALLLPALLGLLWLGAPSARAAEGDWSGVPELQDARALDGLLAMKGLRFGWADYWHARTLRLFSRRGTLCAPMICADGQVDPYLWIGERELFMQGDVLTRPQFVVTNGLDPAALQSKLGSPPEIVALQGMTVWLMVPGQHGGRR